MSFSKPITISLLNIFVFTVNQTIEFSSTFSSQLDEVFWELMDQSQSINILIGGYSGFDESNSFKKSESEISNEY